MRGLSKVVPRVKLAASAAIISLATGAPVAATDMTAGVIMAEMPVRERTAYVMGIVEGMAYARFRSDSKAAGQKDERASGCMYRWLYRDRTASFDLIDAAFRKYPAQFPSTIIAAMLQQECG